ncbi:MAG: hypothetical protein U0269_28130 [Polyangiales bacterium]
MTDDPTRCFSLSSARRSATALLGERSAKRRPAIDPLERRSTVG